MVFDTKGSILASHQVELSQIFPNAGWVEQDPMEILETVKICIEETVKKMLSKGLRPLDIQSIGITNQRETTIVWDKTTGLPLHNSIVWLDTRTKYLVDDILKNHSKDVVQSRCGLPISTYFSAVKLKWLMENVPQVQKAIQEDRLLFGTVDSWLLYHLCGNSPHITDVTNASRTMLMNLTTLDWDPSLLDFFQIPRQILPSIKSSSEIYGYVKEGSLQGLPISGCLGDQHAALVGHGCFEPGSIKNTYGTGCFMVILFHSRSKFYTL